MIIACSYGDANFSQSLNFNLWSAKIFGRADHVVKFGPEDIDEKFKSENIEILSAKKGAGYWLWKPYIINKTVSNAKYGDYVVYADSGSFYMNRIDTFIKKMESANSDMYIGEVDYLEGDYSKRDAFILMGVDGLGFEVRKQIDAAFLLIRKTHKTEKIISNWLTFCCDMRIISDSDNVCGKENFKGFKGHRYDQSVLSLICKKNDVITFRNASTPDKYFTCIEPLTLVNKGRYFTNLKDSVFCKECIDKWKNWKEEYYPPILVRTRFRNMNIARFVIKTIGKAMTYIYRNYISFCFTRVYFKRKD